MRNSQLLCSQLFFFSPVLGDGKRSACSLALVAPSNPFTPMSMNHHNYSACKGLLQRPPATEQEQFLTVELR